MSRPEPPDVRAAPRVLLAGAAAAYGVAEVAGWCADLLAGRADPRDPELPSLLWLGGAPARYELGRTNLAPGEDRYWPRVWGARGLLYVWTPAAAADVRTALTDPSWRVRELAAKLVDRREIGEAADTVAARAGDAVPRVRAAAVRALGAVGEGEHADVLHDAAADPDPAVRAASGRALDRLRRRLDRDL